MQFNEYQRLAMRTNDRKNNARLRNVLDVPHIDIGGVINASLGLSGEVGELNDMIKKAIFHEHPIDTNHVQKEISDVMWYIALMCESFGFDMGEIAQMNIDKLKARYPEGFSVEQSLHRKEGDI